MRNLISPFVLLKLIITTGANQSTSILRCSVPTVHCNNLRPSTEYFAVVQVADHVSYQSPWRLSGSTWSPRTRGRSCRQGRRSSWADAYVTRCRCCFRCAGGGGGGGGESPERYISPQPLPRHPQQGGDSVTDGNWRNSPTGFPLCDSSSLQKSRRSGEPDTPGALWDVLRCHRGRSSVATRRVYLPGDLPWPAAALLSALLSSLLWWWYPRFPSMPSGPWLGSEESRRRGGGTWRPGVRGARVMLGTGRDSETDSKSNWCAYHACWGCGL